jgi:addiction module RelE/StbE family toxin
MYQLDFLPAAMEDMTEIAKYISHVLSNPSAANSLADEMIKSAERLTEFPYINAVHRTVMPLKREYRKLLVQNYLMFYWIDEKEKTVTIARVIYSRRDYDKFLVTT